MKGNIEERVIEVAQYIINNSATVRDAAKMYNISKSTVHKDVTERLEKLNPVMCEEVRKVLDVNKAERHIRGGLATKILYKSRGNSAMGKNKKEKNNKSSL